VTVEATAIVLAGGRSRRIGRPKAFLEIGGRPLIDRVLDALSGAFSEVLIVAPDFTPFTHLGARLVADTHPGLGALGGVYTGLAAAGHPRAIVVGCDMPFLSPALLAHLVARAGGRTAAVPRAADGRHPLHAAYTKDALPVLERAIAERSLKLLDAVARLDALEIGEAEMRRFDPELLSLFNVNRPEDLDRARAIAGPGHGAQASGGS
jgi:molybdenum cofactor guanylyltransferase